MKYRILEREGKFFPQYLNTLEGSTWRVFSGKTFFDTLNGARAYLDDADSKAKAVKVRIHPYP